MLVSFACNNKLFVQVHDICLSIKSIVEKSWKTLLHTIALSLQFTYFIHEDPCLNLFLKTGNPMDCLSFPFTFLKQSNFKNIMKYWSVLINLQKKFLRYV